MPRAKLEKLLEAVGEVSPTQGDVEKEGCGDCEKVFVGIGLDSCVKATRHGQFLIQTTDFFYPLIDDPYLMGGIACANVLSDLYAEGVTFCDNMLMLLASSKDFSGKEMDVVMPMIIRGFCDKAREAGTEVRGGQTVVNPWVIIGGVATSVSERKEIIMPDAAEIGDVLVLTKPLGTQVAVNCYEWMRDGGETWEKVKKVITDDQVRDSYNTAAKNMATLNLPAARLMHEFSAHAATDVTGFGLLGHADNLARAQKHPVRFLLTRFPILSNMAAVESAANSPFKLLAGLSAETSGGLLIAMSQEKAEKFQAKLLQIHNLESWIVGSVVPGERDAALSPEGIEVVEV